MKVLTIDVGGTNVKVLATGQEVPRKFASGKELTAEAMVIGAQQAAADWEYEAVSIGYPGPVRSGRPVGEPFNLSPGWVDFDFAAAFGRPVKLVIDAAMQALGSFDGGKMLFVGLGRGLGSAMVIGGVLAPHGTRPPACTAKGTFEDYVGLRGPLVRLGKPQWHPGASPTSWSALAGGLAARLHTVLGGGQRQKAG